jgi:uncharacterized protein (TIGR04141 family)
MPAPHSVDPLSNRLNVYLTKDIVTAFDDATIISRDKGITKKEIIGVGVLYFKRSFSSTPNWVTNFFNDELTQQEKDQLFTATSRALLVVKVQVKRKSRFFCIPFGSGRFLMKEGIQEERFGLRTCLNILAEDKIRSIGKRTISQNPKASNEQISRASDASDFQIDIEKDLLQSITGHCTQKDFGRIITGKDSLSVSYKIDVRNVVKFLEKCLATYKRDDYKTNFDWIDQIKEIKGKKTVETLNTKLVSLLNNSSKDVWLAPPEIIDWTDFAGFKYSTKKGDDLFEELNMHDLIGQAGGASLDIDYLNDQNITCWSNNTAEISHRWKTYKCLNAEVKKGRSVFILDSGKWYEIDKDFVSKVEAAYNLIPWSSLKLPAYKHTDEATYNVDVSTALSGYCLDANNISHGGGYSKIEFCDVLTANKELLFVKRYSGSATLSHLFAQGYVTGELLLNDDAFRRKVVAELPRVYKKIVAVGEIEAKDYHLYYVIIAKGKKKISMPFFSKVNLKNSYRTLTNYGYKVSLCHVENRN